MYSSPNLELVHCSMSGSNCCFLTHIQISQEADQVVWSSHLLKNFPQYFVIHTVKGIVNKADVFLELSCFFYDPMDVGNLISGSSAFSKPSLNLAHYIYGQPHSELWVPTISQAQSQTPVREKSSITQLLSKNSSPPKSLFQALFLVFLKVK